MANLLAVIIARTAALKAGVRIRGLCAAPLVAYASALVHTCVARALDFCGLGSAALRLVPCEPLSYRMSLSTLKTMVENDRAVGNVPFLLIGTAGAFVLPRLIRP